MNFIKDYCCIRYRRGPMHFKIRPMGQVPYYWIWQAWDRSHVCSKEVYGTACMHRLGINSICLMLVKSQLTPKNEKIKVVSNWLKWREKLVRNCFHIIWRHPPPPSPWENNLVKNKSCSKLAENSSKKIGRKLFLKILTQKKWMKKSKLFQISWNCKKYCSAIIF